MRDPALKPYFDHVLMLFWPVLVWNLVRIARWQACTGQDGLWAVNCFGGVRLVRVSDTPCPEHGSTVCPLPCDGPARIRRLFAPLPQAWAEIARLARPLARRMGKVTGLWRAARSAIAPHLAVPRPEP